MGQHESKRNIKDGIEILRTQQNGTQLIRNKEDGEVYLMRIVTCATESDLERLKALLQFRAKLTNQHLLGLQELEEKRQEHLCSTHFKITLILQYSQRSMAQEIYERNIKPERNFFQESELWVILYSCCLALNTLYSSGNTHESLSAEQIFLCRDGLIKITEPLLFGYEKNHLQAMREKEGGKVMVHLSPEIISCLDDQNFFYYDKEKSDIFVLGMILIDLALLSNNFLFSSQRQRPIFQQIQDLLGQTNKRYSQNFVAFLADILQIESRNRPSLMQIISRIEKTNNIDEFTVESESNIQSRSERKLEKIQRRPADHQQSFRLDLQESKRRPITNVYNTGHSIQEQSLYIKEPTPCLNQQNFDGKVFSSSFTNTAYTFNINPQAHFASIQANTLRPVSIRQNRDPIPQYHTAQTNPFNVPAHLPPPGFPQTIREVGEIQISNPQGSNNSLDWRSKSIDSIRIVKEETKVSQKSQPLFTHEIPEVYNIILDCLKNNQKNGTSNEISQRFNQQPQPFQGEIRKNSGFTGFKKQPIDTVSRFGEELDSPLKIELKNNISYTQSQYEQIRFGKNLVQFAASNANSINPFSESLATPSKGYRNSSPFANSTALPTQKPVDQVNQFANSAANFNRNQSPTASPTFIPEPRQIQNIINSPNHHDRYHSQVGKARLQFVKEYTEEGDRYEGYMLNGLQNGHGTLFFKNGGHYEGEWKDGKMHGFGKLCYESGETAYEGYWENNEFNGQGRVYNQKPISFDGDFDYSDFSGLPGFWIYYEGAFEKDSKHGKGYIQLTNGERFEGSFENDNINGNGIFYKRSGEIVIGHWTDNKLVHGKEQATR